MEGIQTIPEQGTQPPPAMPEGGGAAVVTAPVAPGAIAGATVVPRRGGLWGWLFGPWVSGGSRPISKSSSLRYAVIAVIVGGGAWLYSSAADNAPPLLASSAPVVTRIAASFALAFVIGFVVRKILKMVFFAALIVAVFIAMAKLSGVPLDLSFLRETTAEAIEETRSFAQRLVEVAKLFLPSSIAACVGLWRGGRHDSITA